MFEIFTIIGEIISLIILINAIINLYYYYDFKASTNFYGMLFTMASYLMLVLGKFITFSGGYTSYSEFDIQALIVSLMLHYFILSLLYCIIFIRNRALRIFVFSIPVIIIFRGLLIQNQHVFLESMLVLNLLFAFMADELYIKYSHILFLGFYVFAFIYGFHNSQPFIFIWSMVFLIGTFLLTQGFKTILYSNERWH